MKDLFGNEVPVNRAKSKKIHVSTKKEAVREKVVSKDIGLNSIYKDFGNYLANIRNNKAL